jgi:hypothetical protein
VTRVSTGVEGCTTSSSPDNDKSIHLTRSITYYHLGESKWLSKQFYQHCQPGILRDTLLDDTILDEKLEQLRSIDYWFDGLSIHSDNKWRIFLQKVIISSLV